MTFTLYYNSDADIMAVCNDKACQYTALDGVAYIITRIKEKPNFCWSKSGLPVSDFKYTVNFISIDDLKQQIPELFI